MYPSSLASCLSIQIQGLKVNGSGHNLSDGNGHLNVCMYDIVLWGQDYVGIPQQLFA